MVYNSANVAGASRARHARSQGQCASPNERWQAAAVEATTSLTSHVLAQIKGEIERTTRVAAWSAVQDRLLLVKYAYSATFRYAATRVVAYIS